MHQTNKMAKMEMEMMGLSLISQIYHKWYRVKYINIITEYIKTQSVETQYKHYIDTNLRRDNFVLRVFFVSDFIVG